MRKDVEEIAVVRLNADDIDAASVLFDKYGIFLANDESLLLYAFKKDDRYKVPIGFIQLCPTFISPSKKPVWFLKDLFIDETTPISIREKLMSQAETLAEKTGTVAIPDRNAIAHGTIQELYGKIPYCCPC